MPAVTWTTLTVADLYDAKAAPLIDAAREAVLGADQDDPVDRAIANVVARIRQEIAAGGRTVLAADTATIPPSLRSLAARMAVRELQSRPDVMDALPLTDTDKEAWRQDVRYLERIASGEISVETSDSPEASPSVQDSGASAEQISSTPRRFTRDRLAGL